MNKKIIAIVACAAIGAGAIGAIGAGAIGAIGSGTIGANVLSSKPDETVAIIEIPAVEDLKNPMNQTEYYVSEENKNSSKTKDYLFYKMLNTIDYFNYVEGNMVVYDNLGLLHVDFKSDLVNGKACEEVREVDSKGMLALNKIDFFDADGDYIKAKGIEYIDAGEMTSVDLINKVYLQYADGYIRDKMTRFENSERIVIVDGEKQFYGIGNATNCYYAGEYSLLPQNLIFGFLENQDLWAIKSTEKLLNRDCVVIEGKADNGYGEKLGVDTFTIYVDLKTGVWLKFEGFNEIGELSFYSHMEDISFLDKPMTMESASDFLNAHSNFERTKN